MLKSNRKHALAEEVMRARVKQVNNMLDLLGKWQENNVMDTKKVFHKDEYNSFNF